MMNKRDSKEKLIDMRSQMLMRWPTVSYSTLPLIILICLVVASLFGYMLTSENLVMSRQLAVNRMFHDNELRIGAEFHIGDNLLKGGAGMLQGEPVTNVEWQEFIGAYDLKNDATGLEATGVAYGTDPESVAVAYVSPLTSTTKNLIGTNPALTPGVSKAMVDAARSGNTTVSQSLPPVVSARADAMEVHDFLMVRPFYDSKMPHGTPDERDKALRGFVFALFRGDVFFDDIYRDVDLAHTKLQIYLGTRDRSNLQYQADQTTDADQTINTQHLKLYGQTVTVVYTQDTAHIIPYITNYLPQYLLFGGLALGVFVGLISAYMLRSRYRRLIYQKEQDVNFAKDELLSLASHQLRTPATGVKQYLGMVLQGFAGDLNEQQKTYLERAYSSNNRQLHVINDILHLAKLESGRIVLAEHKFDIADMLREVVDEQRDDAEKGQIALELKAPSSGMIVGDSHMLRMVIENLISNAIKYTEPQGKVSIRLIRRGMHWTLIVKDTGVGIAKKDTGKLFKQFSRISNPRTEYVTGTGIGLYLSHHLVVLHGGSISVSSDEGKGSTFTVRLPRKL